MRRLALCAVGLATVACVERDPPQKKIDPAYVAKNLLTAEPAVIANKAAADFDGKVVYLGCDAEPATLVPGGSATVVHYWKVVEPPGDDWKVFSHLTGNGDDWMNLDYSDMRAGHPPAKWQAGQIIRDEQTFDLGTEWRSPFAQLSVGLYRKGATGVDGRMPITSGPADKERRALAFRFKVEKSGTLPAAPEYRVRKARAAIAVDGVGDEQDWAAAPLSPTFVQAQGGPKVAGSARARLLWDDQYLYALIEVEDDEIHSQYQKQDDPLWKEDVVELFIDADKSRRGYVELQVNPQNAHFDAFFPQTRAQPHHFEWQSAMKSAVSIRGTLDARDDTDQGWTAEIAIPLGDVKGMDAAMKVKVPPEIGDSWRLNVIRVDKPEEGSLGASSWSPITIRDFHALARMLTVVFADADGNVGGSGSGPGPGSDSGSKGP